MLPIMANGFSVELVTFILVSFAIVYQWVSRCETMFIAFRLRAQGNLCIAVEVINRDGGVQQRNSK